MVCFTRLQQAVTNVCPRLQALIGHGGDLRPVGIIFAGMRQETWIGWMAWPSGFAHASFRDFTGADGRCSANPFGRRQDETRGGMASGQTASFDGVDPCKENRRKR